MSDAGSANSTHPFPRQVMEIEHTWIGLADGIKLAARIWLPQDAEQRPVPAILEYLPYRKRDGTAERDQLTHPYYAGHGYAAVRVDIRGNGESEGLMLDEYLEQEQDDALEVIQWITAQPWCDGNVGMMGISWGGFNSLQVAARRPPALKAIITLCSTDDRYADDIHYKGGALLMENLGWAATMFAFSSRPPDPVLVGERWHAMWMERLRNTPLLLETWLRHPHRDDYWKHGSVCADFGAIEAAVYAIGGWGDAYSNAIPRMLQGLRAPARGLTGPWIHKYPHCAVPQPAIGYLQDSLRWWDYWLKTKDNGVMDKPLYQVYMMDGVPPAAFYENRPGRWIAEHSWPSANVELKTHYLARGLLRGRPGPGAELVLSSPENTGTACGEYCAMWQGPESPTDQRWDDAGSLIFDSPPLAEALEVFGAPAVDLELSATQPQANIVVRLCDLWPTGESTRITYGLLNLCHRDSHEHPTPLEPGKRYRIRIQLDDVAYKIAAGHGLRLALSTAYWPLIWPSPRRVTATLFTAQSALHLPQRKPMRDDPPAFDAPAFAPPLEIETIRAASNQRTVQHDMATGETVLRIVDDFGQDRILSHGLVAGQRAKEIYRIQPNAPNSCRADIHWTQTLARDEWAVRTETRTTLRSDSENFYIDARLEAFEGEREVFSETWHRTVKRVLV